MNLEPYNCQEDGTVIARAAATAPPQSESPCQPTIDDLVAITRSLIAQTRARLQESNMWMVIQRDQIDLVMAQLYESIEKGNKADVLVQQHWARGTHFCRRKRE